MGIKSWIHLIYYLKAQGSSLKSNINNKSESNQTYSKLIQSINLPEIFFLH